MIFSPTNSVIWSSAAVERWSFHAPGEPFEPDRNAPRGGPVAHVELYCLKGRARVQAADDQPGERGARRRGPAYRSGACSFSQVGVLTL